MNEERSCLREAQRSIDMVLMFVREVHYGKHWSDKKSRRKRASRKTIIVRRGFHVPQLVISYCSCPSRQGS